MQFVADGTAANSRRGYVAKRPGIGIDRGVFGNVPVPGFRKTEDGDSSVDESDLLQAAQGERRAAESGIWWSVASVIGPVSASS